MKYKLINPSDPYTFVAKNKEVAALTVFCLSTMYGSESQDGKETVPIFIFGGSREWYESEFHRTTDEGLEAEKESVIQALQSFMLGNFEDRRRYEAALNAITDPEKKEKFMEEWQDGRSSLNDIGSYAHKLAKKMAEEIT